jgi:hypothetical protein
MDIVERLMRQIETGPDVEDIVFINPDGPDAADEIERLREALKKISEWPDYRLPSHQDIARSALQQKDNE